MPWLALVMLLGVIEFEVEVPAGTEGPVYVAHSPDWKPDALRLERDAEGVWRGRLEAEGAVEWKVTRGDWSTVEKGPKGEEVSNRTARPGVARARVARWASGGGDTAAISSSLVDLGVWKPKTLPSPRRVVAYLPPGYERDTAKRYPVLYVLDGQNQFDPKRSFLGVVWALDKAADAHVAAGREPFIAIAIDNTPERADEYLPSKDPRRNGGGRLEDFARFISQELKPRVDDRFRTKPGPDDTGILGSSFGGMAAFHLGWRHPETFRRVGSVSPSLWWNDQETKALVEKTKVKPPLRIWLDMGTREGKDEKASKPYLESARAVRDALVSKGFTLGKDLDYLEAEGAVHNEGAWQERLPKILAFLFP